MTTETTITATNAAELAHTYHLYLAALGAANDAGVTIYGEWLLSMQARMGVELTAPQAIRATIAIADQRLGALLDA